MEKVTYGGWEDCVRLSNQEIELVITTAVGPRLIRCGFIGGQNLFKEYPEALGQKNGSEWELYGGHRLWHAPEAKPRTYFPDNQPIKTEWDGQTLTTLQPVEPTTGIEKRMEISLAAQSNRITVVHRLVNHNLWPIETAVWCLSVMAENGRGIYPQEDFRAHTDYLLPARPLVLWHYTDMADSRWHWGTRFMQLEQDPTKGPQKIGFRNTKGWAGYYKEGDVFIKRFSYDPDAIYPDHGCNTETFTNEDMLEVESLGPLRTVQPGECLEHTETWSLHKAELSLDEACLEEKLLPLI